MSQKKPWFQTKAFLKEREKWYKKLAKAGFQDSEIVDWRTGEEGNLLKGHGSYTSAGDFQRNWTPAGERYYTALRQRSWEMENEGYTADQAEAVRLVGEGESLGHVRKLLGISMPKLKDLLAEQIRIAAWERVDDDDG